MRASEKPPLQQHQQWWPQAVQQQRLQQHQQLQQQHQRLRQEAPSNILQEETTDTESIEEDQPTGPNVVSPKFDRYIKDLLVDLDNDVAAYKAGNIKHNKSHWLDFTSDSWVLQTITGADIEVVTMPI